MNKRYEKLCVWMALLSLMIAGNGFFMLAKFIPPHWPSWDAAHIANLYTEHRTQILIGMVLIQLSTGLLIPFYAVLYQQIRRIEGARGRVMSSTYIMSTIAALFGGAVLATVFFMAAAFRPDRSPEITQIFNDIGWFLITFPLGGFGYINFFILAWVILSDKRERPLFPRWLGFATIWVMMLGTPAALVPFFMDGPFAWNGIIAFWIPIGAFAIWFPCFFVQILKSIDRHDYVSE